MSRADTEMLLAADTLRLRDGPKTDARNRGIAWGLDWALAELNSLSDALDQRQPDG